MKVPFITLSVFAGLSIASPYASDDGQTNLFGESIAVGSIWIDFSGMYSVDSQGSLNNQTLDLLLGQGVHILGVGWDFAISTFEGSWLSDVVIDFDGQFLITPGTGHDHAGTASSSSGGIIELWRTGQDFYLDQDGILDIEIFESYIDNPGEPEAQFMAGSTLYIQFVNTPTPSTLITSGIGILYFTRRRR